MIRVKVYGKLFDIYNCSNFPYLDFYLENKKNFLLKGRGKKKYKIYEDFGAFDTESTKILFNDKDIAFTYVWGIAFNNYIIVGRYYEELQIFLNKIKKLFDLQGKDKFIIYVHNLSYDFMFFYQFIEELDPESFSFFATHKRKILKCGINGFEFRDSYKLTNMSLKNWSKKEKGVVYKKLPEMDYNKKYYPMDHIQKGDFRYFIGDLLSLHDCMKHKLENEELNLFNIPMTATGYVREQTKKETSLIDYRYRYYLSLMTLTIKTYKMLNLLKEGGDTHTNRFYQGEVIEADDIGENMRSKDIKSSYPTEMLRSPVPISNFIYYGEITSIKEFKNVLSDYACMFMITFKNIRIKKFDPLSCISVSKIIKKGSIDITDNGRLIEGTDITLCINEIKYQHIAAHYTFDKIKVWDMYIAEKGLIPKLYRDSVFNLFKGKCELEKYKGTENVYYYEKYKNLLNACYGMALTDIYHEEIVLGRDEEGQIEWQQLITKSLEEQIDKYNNQWDRHLFYAWGMWIVDNARSSLYELIDCCDNPIYWDTDSCKGYNWNEEKLAQFNKKRYDFMKKNNYLVNIDGKEYCLGLAEEDGEYKKFIGMGAKKYCYLDTKDKLHITVAGVSKEGAKHLKDIYDFKTGLVFPTEYAGSCAKYNDEDIHYLNQGKKRFRTASNIAICPTEYTLKACDDYLAKAYYTSLEQIN